LDIVELLLSRHAPIDVPDASFDATPLGWALYGWGNEPASTAARYYPVVRRLVSAGAAVKPEWLEHPVVRADAKMMAALKGV
jgi:hypothetical protein